MSILNLFKKAPKGPSVNVRVWINQAAKEKALIRLAQAEKTFIFIAWSEVTCQHFQEVFRKQNIVNEVMSANDILPSRMTGKNFVFIERHYDHLKEIKLLESMKATDVLVHVALSDPLISAFDSDRIQKLLESMGHNKDEYIEHKMINKSIERAMENIKNGDFPKDNSKALIEWIEGIV